MRIVIRGAVQGVGFRPFAYRLAREMDLPGWVLNSPQGVFLEVEGETERLHDFLLRLERERPPRAIIQSLEYSLLPPKGFTDFVIRSSDGQGARVTLVLPDIATCGDCLRELFDPADRRYRYPFTNCTNCGPRFSIIRGLPYDRPNTTMASFPLCEACQREYDDPADRRFHAQPTACPVCGPHLELWDGQGSVLALHHDALLAAVVIIRRGGILAVKGLGGFHLLVNAANEEAVRLLRARKHREEKPLAMMYPSLEQIRRDCEVSPLEERLLRSPEAPIVLLRRLAREGGPATAGPIAPSVAPRNPCLGVMLPYTPLHHLLLREAGVPLVATSGNLTDEPICIDEQEAVRRLGSIADAFLVHNRPIARHVDDSIARVILGRELVLRRARGYAPLPVHLERPVPCLLAVGGHLKSAVAASLGQDVFLSQHIGDLETTEALGAFRRVIADFESLYDLHPVSVACDVHPDYLSTQFAQRSGLPVVRVQHHYAHVLACMAENGLAAPVLGVSWDGTGYGLDHTLWGGEFLRITETGFERVASFRSFRLPGGERAIREPRRAALGLLYELFGEDLFRQEDLPPVRTFPAPERPVLAQMLARRLNAPATTSAGRLFDVVAALLALRLDAQFEGQAAMELEWSLEGTATDEAYLFPLTTGEVPALLDWEPAIRQILQDLRGGRPPATIAAKFHNGLADAVLTVAKWVGEPRVVLTGGCFQNRYLTERTVGRLLAAGLSPLWHQRVPPNDGGIALGQILAAARSKE